MQVDRAAHLRQLVGAVELGGDGDRVARARVALLARNIGPAHSVAESIGRAGGHASHGEHDARGDGDAVSLLFEVVTNQLGDVV